MKKILFILCSSLSWAMPASANATCRPLDVFQDSTYLSPNQQRLMLTLSEMYKEKYYLTKDFHAERLNMMVAYIRGEHSRTEVHETIVQTHDRKSVQDSELQTQLYEILVSLSQSQQDQLRQNLTLQASCFVERKQTKDDRRPKIGVMLYEGVNLTAGQRALLNEMFQDRRSSMPAKRYGLHHESLIDWYLKDSVSRNNADWLFAEETADDKAFRYSQAEAMMDLLDSFTPAQQTQFLENVQAVLKLSQ